jgi:O-antigen ligase
MRSLSFILFVLLTGVVFLRPSDIVVSLRGVPVYALLLVSCLAVSAPCVVEQLSLASLRTRPTTVCVLGLMPAAALSHLSRFQIGPAMTIVWDLFPTVLYYLLLVGVLDTSERLRRFLCWVLVFILGQTILALLQHHGIIDNPALAAVQERVFDDETGEITGILNRLSGAGIFANPNDLSRILVVGIALSLYCFDGGAPALLRPLWVAALAAFVYALVLTQSRGGLIGLGATLLVLFHARFGTRTTLVLGGALLPVAAALFGGSRQADMSMSGGTSQQRIQFWSHGLEAFRSTPVFGTGTGTYPEFTGGYGAHNSYVEAYVEMGFLGGTLFVGAVFGSLWACFLLGRPACQTADPALPRVRPYLIAILAGYAVGMMSTHRTYIITTYVLIGWVVVYNSLGRADLFLPSFQVTRRLVLRGAILSAFVLAAIKIYVMATVQLGTKI